MLALFILNILVLFLTRAAAIDWSAPERELARKIVAVTGGSPVSLSFENRSSLGMRDNEIIQNGMRGTLQAMGAHFNDQATASVKISLSENLTSYVWVAEIRNAGSNPAVALVSTPRPASAVVTHDSVPLTLQKMLLWNQVDPILDVAVLEESAAGPTRIAVLAAERVSLYRLQAGKWQQEQALEIAHTKPWPRDLRGRLLPARDHSLDAYLPGVVCHGAATAPFGLNCRDGQAPWPLTPQAGSSEEFRTAGSALNASLGIGQTYAFFAAARNFFTGDLSIAGRYATVPKFYAAALLERERNPLWFLAGVDGQVHIFDGAHDRVAKMNWGADVASVKTACGAGWQILTTSPGNGSDSVRAYEVPDRDPIAVSAAIDFPGPISALWTESRADTAVAISKNPETDTYEAFRLAVACNQ